MVGRSNPRGGPRGPLNSDRQLALLLRLPFLSTAHNMSSAAGAFTSTASTRSSQGGSSHHFWHPKCTKALTLFDRVSAIESVNERHVRTYLIMNFPVLSCSLYCRWPSQVRAHFCRVHPSSGRGIGHWELSIFTVVCLLVVFL